MKFLPFSIFFLFLSSFVLANDGYKLWMQYYPIENAESWQKEGIAKYQINATSPTLAIINDEIKRAGKGFFNFEPAENQENPKLIISKLSDLNLTTFQINKEKITALGEDGFSISKSENSETLILANTDIGLLYGTFYYLQLIQKGSEVPKEGIFQSPKIKHRVLNHWDNLDRTVERGYSGFSIWNWHRLPRHIDQQYLDYARANASIGINGTVLTNVNANSLVLTTEYLEKVKALADAFRPYGIKVYLTARFSSPIELGRLKTADPLNEVVQNWWKEKAKEVYDYIPDFGGFVVKADSEGQPGPHNYGRTQADGANMLADAVAPFGGIVMWRAFVYSENTPDDRHKQAYNEFKPIDGEFRNNVIVQVKNGAIDFQPREPFHPMFGAMPNTPLMMEFQITQEYLGHDTHLAFLAPMYEEVLKEDTFVNGKGREVAKIVDGSLDGHSLSAMAGVANIGTDRNWTGHHFHQANWYAYGKLAWNPYENSEKIADDWLRLTFNNDDTFITPVKEMMLESREMVVNYMTPLGLHHIMAESHHYGPGPWVTGGSRADWTSTYYHQASESGVGFDRTKSGSNALGQYSENLQSVWGNINSIPEKYLLWFHHVPWEHKLQNGENLWNNLALHYQKGVDEARANVKLWESMKGKIDQERFEHTLSFMKIQAEEAAWWRDACLLYFGQFSKMPLPSGVESPKHNLEYYMNYKPKNVPGI
ncbi:alpha-glucuronidase [Belliella baltica DSM 15883]|uniref:Xylan alpha-1,2-glucuronidase n=1 Tax=Belliella baltica (strain DSM 15883 / CIP 108006 / LMG 21964 / BA134) TaxID=866536 RepID=I3Z684_BELBD|nr:alpha-glucuronidase family glycosyl hydrolase [Belliella baltica]AFL84752.1 alpha-glucuronidase [Belliella baltica DSM 15883]